MVNPIQVSVVIPTFNRKEWLKECLALLSKQTFPREKFEIVVVDDGSSDGTEDIVHSFKDIVYLRQKNQGQATARNLGLSAARGEIIAFTDDDCLPEPEWIANGVLALKEKGLDCVEGETLTDREGTSPLSVLTYTYHGGGYMTANCFYKKKALEAVGGFAAARHMRFREDTDMAWRVMDAGFKLGFDPRPRVFHRVVKLNAWKYVKKHIRIQEPYWNCYLAKYHSEHYRESSEMILGWVSTQTMYHYIFWGTLGLSLLSWIYLPLSAFLISLIVLFENYMIVVFLHSRMRSAIELKHILAYPGEFLQLCSVWWIAIISDTFWKIWGNLRFGVLTL